MRSTAALTLALLLSALSFSPAAAQGAPPPAAAAAASPETPEQVAQRAVELARSGEWEGFARLMHPNDLGELKKLFREILVVDTSGQFATGLFGIDNLEAYDKLEGFQVLANLMRTMTQMAPDMAEAMGSLDSETLGSVPEGSDVVHLVQRSKVTMGALTVKKMEVTSLKKHEGKWLMLAKGELQGMAEALKAAAQQQAALAAEAGASGDEAVQDGAAEGVEPVSPPGAP